MGNQHVEPQPANTKSTRSFDPDATMSNLSVITTRCDRRTSGNSTRDVPLPFDVSWSCLPKSSSNIQSSNGSVLSAPPTHDLSPSPTTVAPRHRRRSSLLLVQNGVTGKFVSSRICKIAATFWKDNIETLSASEELEIGCSIFFNMISTNRDMRQIMKRNRCSTRSIESTSVQYLHMMGWLMRHLVSDKIDLYCLLDKLGALHCQMGIKIRHFTAMLQAMHESFAYYFAQKYNIEVKYAMDEIFSFTAQVMTGQNLHYSSHLMDLCKQFQTDDIPFLQNLDVCLKSAIGTEYLYRFLSQTWCDEIVIFLQSLKRFKRVMTDKARFFVAREINKHSIDPLATLSLNLSYHNRQNTLQAMSELETKFALKESFEVPADFYSVIEKDILKLICDNHWHRFVQSIEALQLKSFELQP